MKSIVQLSLLSMFIACNSVETIRPVEVDIMDAVFASGHIISDLEYQVTANTEGYLLKSYVEEGSRVAPDMPLFQITNEVQSEQLSNAEVNYADALASLDPSSPERAQLELQLAQAKSQLEVDRKNHERYEKLLASRAVSPMEYEKVKLQFDNSLRNVEIQQQALQDMVAQLELNSKNAKTQLVIQKESNADYFLSSAIEGEMLKVIKQPGELVRRGETVARVGGGQKLVRLFISEEDINRVALNQEVVISLNTDKERLYEAGVCKIYPSFDEIEQSFIVEAAFKEEPEILFYNTQLQANIIIGSREKALVIPPQYLSEGDSVKLDGGEIRFVQVGIRNDEWVEILHGIDETSVLQKQNSL